MRVLCCALLLSACASSNTTFNVDYARNRPVADFKQISVLGVFKDGRLNEVHWDEIAAGLATALGPAACDLGFSERLKTEEPDLFSHADVDSKEGGITDDLLKPFAPRARGTAILAVTISGRLHEAQSFRSETMERTTGKSTTRGRSAKVADEIGLDVTINVYSVADQKTAFNLGLHYTGGSLDEAYQLLGQKLKALVPNATCAGWRWK